MKLLVSVIGVHLNVLVCVDLGPYDLPDRLC
jgi:hypothetical protein